MATTSVLTAEAHELQVQLEAGELTSVDLVKLFLSQIRKHNHEGLRLNAVLSVCPEESAVAQAARLDQERRDGRLRSKLHGIPVIVKVSKPRVQAGLRGEVRHAHADAEVDRMPSRLMQPSAWWRRPGPPRSPGWRRKRTRRLPRGYVGYCLWLEGKSL